jgi:steroid delta-isomerase-like uncharacterized protein
MDSVRNRKLELDSPLRVVASRILLPEGHASGLFYGIFGKSCVALQQESGGERIERSLGKLILPAASVFSKSRGNVPAKRAGELGTPGSETLQEDIEVNAIQVAKRYFQAWNQRAEAIVATFAEGGTYTDPSAGQGLTGEAIGGYAKGLWAAFPDLSFEIISAAETDGGVVSSQWLMRGTNTGSLLGLPPTGRTVALPGADFIQVEGEKIRSVRGYFDSRSVPDSLDSKCWFSHTPSVHFRLGQAPQCERARKTNRELLVSLCSRLVQRKRYNRSRSSAGRLRPKCWRCQALSDGWG